jgi:mitochondrial fission protein ELM1
MRLQAIGLAEAMTRHRPEFVISEFQAKPHWMIRTLPRLGHYAPFLPLYARAPDIATVQKRPVRGRHADLLITCGRRTRRWDKHTAGTFAGPPALTGAV